MDTAKAVYAYTQSREQALLKELRAVEAEEKNNIQGGSAETANDSTFSNVSTKVDAFDANAELRKGVQETAKKYGEVAGAGLGYVGEKTGGLIGKDAAQIGKAAGLGVGDGVGGILGSFGTLTNDAIDETTKKVEDTRQFANDLAVDPAGALTTAAKNKLNETQETIVNLGSTAGKIVTGDTDALIDTLTPKNLPVIGNGYATLENIVRAGNALYTGGPMDGIVNDQYDVAAKSIADAGSEAFAAFPTPGKIVGEKIDDFKKRAVVGGMVRLQKDLTLDIHTDSSKLHTRYLKNAAKVYDRLENAKELAGQVGEALNIEAKENASPSQALDALQVAAPGHEYNPAPALPSTRPAVDVFSQAMIASPAMTLQPLLNQGAAEQPTAPDLEQQPQQAPEPVSNDSFE